MSSPRRSAALRRDLDAIVAAGIDAVDAGRLLTRALEREDAVASAAAVRVLCAGKASHRMAAAAVDALGARLVRGLVVSPDPTRLDGPFETVVGGHPLPTTESERAGRLAIALAGSAARGELFLCLLSGGASALMALPADGITLADKQATTNRLLKGGADITTLNTVRKHLSAIKGGQLAARAGAGTRTFAVSDVVGDDLAVIGSGPTVPDRSRFADALDALRAFGGADAYPAAVVARLEAGARGEIPETPKPSDPRLASDEARVIGSRVTAMDGACAAAERLGYQVVRIDEPVVGQARQAAEAHMRTVRERLGALDSRVCVVSSGETTVHVTGSGRGGRNQEFALAASSTLADIGAQAMLASVGTDGVDGPTDAAGAVADTTTLERARQAGLDPERFLAENDSYTFFSRLGDLIITGPTETNVGDFQVVLVVR